MTNLSNKLSKTELNNKEQDHYYSEKAKLAIYAEGALGTSSAKSAEGVLRYAKNPIVCVIDSKQTGKNLFDVCGIRTKYPVPIVSSIEECINLKPDALLLGTAWSGGELPQVWRPEIIKALNFGLDIINGLHDFLEDDEEIARTAIKNNCKLFDLRRPPTKLKVASGLCLSLSSYILLTVGSDCSVGKMTTALELHNTALKAGVSSKFVATGQTGIMISGQGITIDRVIGDFMAGAVESLVVSASLESDLILVEGQGSLTHPGFSGVTLALLHGACPDGLILCHDATRKTIKGNDSFPIRSLLELIDLYENMSKYMKPAKVIGIALNTRGLQEDESAFFIEKVRNETGLFCCDPVKQGAQILFEALKIHKNYISKIS